MWNVGLQIQRLSLSEPHVTLGNSRAGHWYFLVSQKFFSNVKDILQISHFTNVNIFHCPNLRSRGFAQNGLRLLMEFVKIIF